MSQDPRFNVNGRKFKFALKFPDEEWKVPKPSFILTDNGCIGQFLSSPWCKFIIPEDACGMKMCVVSIPTAANSRDAFNALKTGDADILTSVEVTEEELEYAKGLLLQKLSEKEERHVSNYIGDDKLSIKITAYQQEDNEDSDIMFTLCCPGFNL